MNMPTECLICKTRKQLASRAMIEDFLAGLFLLILFVILILGTAAFQE